MAEESKDGIKKAITDWVGEVVQRGRELAGGKAGPAVIRAEDGTIQLHTSADRGALMSERNTSARNDHGRWEDITDTPEGRKVLEGKIQPHAVFDTGGGAGGGLRKDLSSPPAGGDEDSEPANEPVSVSGAS